MRVINIGTGPALNCIYASWAPVTAHNDHFTPWCVERGYDVPAGADHGGNVGGGGEPPIVGSCFFQCKVPTKYADAWSFAPTSSAIVIGSLELVRLRSRGTTTRIGLDGQR